MLRSRPSCYCHTEGVTPPSCSAAICATFSLPSPCASADLAAQEPENPRLQTPLALPSAAISILSKSRYEQPRQNFTTQRAAALLPNSRSTDNCGRAPDVQPPSHRPAPEPAPATPGSRGRPQGNPCGNASSRGRLREGSAAAPPPLLGTRQGTGAATSPERSVGVGLPPPPARAEARPAETSRCGGFSLP